MKFQHGERVFLIHSGEMGIVKYFYDDSVVIDINGDEIEVSEDEIIKASEFGLTTNKEQPTEKQVPSQQKFDVKGIAIAFKAVKKLSGEVDRFEMYLVNHTNEHLLFEYLYYLSQTIQHKIKKDVSKNSVYMLNEFKTDYLNDNPVFRFLFWLKDIKPDYKNQFEKEIKLKPKVFFSKMDSKEFGERGYFIIEIENDIPSQQKSKFSEINENDDNDFWNRKNKVKEINEVIIKAEMPDFIDLHIEKLHKNFSQLQPGEILQIQLRQFRNYLEKAIQHNLYKIYVVHGLGKGVLKNEIKKILAEYPEVESYNNDYNPRFGFGATEIFISK